MTRTAWRAAFWALTALVVGMEVWAAKDRNPVTETWTEALTRFIPAPVLLAAVAWFATWLVQHFRQSKRTKEATPPEEFGSTMLTQAEVDVLRARAKRPAGPADD